MNRKKAGMLLCSTGVVLILLGGYTLLHNSHPQKQSLPKIVTTEQLAIEEPDSEEIDSTMTADTATSADERKDSKATVSQVQANIKEKSAHDINSEVYEWPCGKEEFANMEEPEDIIYFAKNKKLFDRIVEQFDNYKGRDIDFGVTMIDGELWEVDEGNVSVEEYNREDIEKLFQDSYIDGIFMNGQLIKFTIREQEFNCIYYSYNDDVDYYAIVNIAPHWWWQTGSGH